TFSADRSVARAASRTDASETPPLVEREKRLIHQDGRLVWARTWRVPIGDESGQLRYHVSIVIDVSERRQAEEALREAEELARAERDFCAQVLETADALIVVLDPAGRIVRFNNKCVSVTGYAEDEVRGRHGWEFLLPPAHAPAVRAVFDALAEGKQNLGEWPSTYENPWVTRSGEERLIVWHNSIVRDAQGQLRYVIGAGIDVTQER